MSEPDEYVASKITVYNVDSMSLVEIIRHIERLPAFLPEENIHCLEAFLLGWWTGRRVDEHDERMFTGFQKFVRERCSTGEYPAADWSWHIRSNSKNPESALEQFFTLFNEYQDLERGSA